MTTPDLTPEVKKAARKLARRIEDMLRDWSAFRKALDALDPWEMKDFKTELRAECLKAIKETRDADA